MLVCFSNIEEATSISNFFYGASVYTLINRDVDSLRFALVVWALFLPAWFSSLSGISYPNENLTGTFLIGGFLILGANFLLLEKRPG